MAAAPTCTHHIVSKQCLSNLLTQLSADGDEWLRTEFYAAYFDTPDFALLQRNCWLLRRTPRQATTSEQCFFKWRLSVPDNDGWRDIFNRAAILERLHDVLPAHAVPLDIDLLPSVMPPFLTFVTTHLSPRRCSEDFLIDVFQFARSAVPEPATLGALAMLTRLDEMSEPTHDALLAGGFLEQAATTARVQRFDPVKMALKFVLPDVFARVFDVKQEQINHFFGLLSDEAESNVDYFRLCEAIVGVAHRRDNALVWPESPCDLSSDEE